MQGLPGVQLRFGQKVEEVLRDSGGRACGVRTSDGPLHAPLVLGCDGRHSKIRPLLGLAEKARLVSFSVAMRLPDSAPLLPHPTFGHIFLGAWGPMLIYPIGGTIGGEAPQRSDARGCFDVTGELSGGPKGAADLIAREYENENAVWLCLFDKNQRMLNAKEVYYDNAEGNYQVEAVLKKDTLTLFMADINDGKYKEVYSFDKNYKWNAVKSKKK